MLREGRTQQPEARLLAGPTPGLALIMLWNNPLARWPPPHPQPDDGRTVCGGGGHRRNAQTGRQRRQPTGQRTDTGNNRGWRWPGSGGRNARRVRSVGRGALGRGGGGGRRDAGPGGEQLRGVLLEGGERVVRVHRHGPPAAAPPPPPPPKQHCVAKPGGGLDPLTQSSGGGYTSRPPGPIPPSLARDLSPGGHPQIRAV